MKKYHYFVSYNIFDSEGKLIGMGNSGCFTTKKIEVMEEIKTMEKRLEEHQEKGNKVVINNFKMLRVEY